MRMEKRALLCVHTDTSFVVLLFAKGLRMLMAAVIVMGGSSSRINLHVNNNLEAGGEKKGFSPSLSLSRSLCPSLLLSCIAWCTYTRCTAVGTHVTFYGRNKYIAEKWLQYTFPPHLPMESLVHGFLLSLCRKKEVKCISSTKDPFYHAIKISLSFRTNHSVRPNGIPPPFSVYSPLYLFHLAPLSRRAISKLPFLSLPENSKWSFSWKRIWT